jgi:hypothetical protein
MQETLRDNESRFTRPPGKAAAVLIGIYVAMYMATAGIVRVLTVHDAVATNAQYGSTAQPMNAGPAASTGGDAESLPMDTPAPAPERMDNARECDRTRVIDSACLFN